VIYGAEKCKTHLNISLVTYQDPCKFSKPRCQCETSKYKKILF